MCKKASRQLNILKRIGKYMNRLGRLTSYYSFLFRSEYFFFRRVRIFFFLLRKARHFFQNLTLDYMTKTLNQIIFVFLHQNQNIFFSNIRIIAIETFKIIHRKSPQYSHDLIDIKARSYNFRSKNTAAVPRVRTTRYGLKSFRYNVVLIIKP